MPGSPELQGYLRHIRACRNANLANANLANASMTGERVPFRIGGQLVGWVAPPLAAALHALPEITGPEPGGHAAGLCLADAAALPRINRELAERGLFRWRGEAFDVRATPDGPVLAQLDRGALPGFGVVSVGAHLNGFVRRADGLHLWVARRAASKALDPGKLDNLVAGGVPAGLGPDETLIKEAGEEAAIPPDLAARARQVGVVTYAMERPEGLRRDRLHCYDLELPADFIPVPSDGEVECFELWPAARVRDAVRDGDDFKFNVNLVLIDFFLRHGLIAGDAARVLRKALDTT